MTLSVDGGGAGGNAPSVKNTALELARELASRDGLTDLPDRSSLMLRRDGEVSYRENRFGDLGEAAVLNPALLCEVSRAGVAYSPNWGFRDGDRVGVLRESPANAVRWNAPPEDKYAPGVLVEETAATNLVENSRLLNAKLGDISGAGKLPDNWLATYAGGKIEVEAFGKRDNWNYVRLRFSGTFSGETWIEMTGLAEIAGVSGNQFVLSCGVRLVAGTDPGTFRIGLIERDSGGGFEAYHRHAVIALDEAHRRYIHAATLADADTANVTPMIYHSSTGAVDFTIDVFLPQVETGLVATSPAPAPENTIATATRTAETRGAGVQFTRASRAISMAWSGKNGDPAGPAREYLPNVLLSDESCFHRAFRSTTNLLPNPAFDGAALGVIGSGGGLGTGLTLANGGMTWEVTKLYDEGARRVMRIKLSGTASSDASLGLCGTADIAGLQNEHFTGHYDIRVLSGTMPGTPQIRLMERNSGGSTVASAGDTLTLDARWRRACQTRTFTESDAAYCQPVFYIDDPSGAVDCEFELALPMCEKLSFPTMPTRPDEGTTGTSTRALGVFKMDLADWFDINERAFGFLIDVTTPKGDTESDTNNYVLGIGDLSSGDNYYYLRRTSSGWNLAVRRAATFTVGTTATDTYADGERRRIAARLEPDNFRLVADGGAVLTDGSGELALAANLEKLVLGNHAFGSPVDANTGVLIFHEVRFFFASPSNDELDALVTI
jgi:hypothetical protein